MPTRRVHGASCFNAPGTFAGIAFSPDSRTLVALLPGEDSTRCVSFAVDSGAVVAQREIKGLWRHVRVLPGGDLIVSSWGKVRRLSPSGKTVWTVEGEQALHLGAVSPDGSLLATVKGASAQVRETKRGTVVHTVREKEGDLYAVAFSADGGLLATGSSKGMVRLYDARKGKEQAKRKSNKVISLAFSPGGELLLVGQGTGKVELWQVNALRPVSSFVGYHGFEQGGGAGCRWVCFSPDGKRAFSLGNERRLRSWSIPGGGKGPAIEVPGRHEQGSVTALSPDGRWLATGSTPGALSVWSTKDGEPVVKNAVQAPIQGLALTPRAVVAASMSSYASWARSTGAMTEIPAVFPPTDVKGLSSGLLVRLDYQSIFVGKTLDPKADSAFELSEYASGALSLSRGGTLLAAPAQNNVELWELKRGVCLATLPHAERTMACAFGPKDAWLVTADEALHLWRLGKTPEVIRDIVIDSGGSDTIVRGLAVSERGWIAVSVDGSDNNASAESSLLVVDPRSGETVARLERPGVRLGQVAFVGGARIAVVDSSGRLLLADAADPQKAHWLEAQEAEDVWPEGSMREALPLATLGDDVAYVGPDGNVVVQTLPQVKPEAGAPFLLEALGAEGAKPEAMFEQRLAGTRFLFAGRFKDTSANFRELTVKELGGEVATKPDAKVTHVALGENPSAALMPALAAKGAKFKSVSEPALAKLLLPTAGEARALLRNEVKNGARRWNTWRERYVEAGGEDFPTSLQGIDLEGLDLQQYRLAVLDFTGAKLAGANLSGVDLFDTVFRGADLRGAIFTGARCFRTVFSGADLRKARLGVYLASARFDGADLRDADLLGAELMYANFSGADLRGARLPEKLTDVKYDARTRWPKGMRPPA
ncbi:pentapeptide repeat-containing protein [Hyalangium rubrum]|uniref:Pentapeptide repeat-containing protein n=1 Tax=Hyalangium rubrum TaxID=3103134 RepID=A0ABU5HIT3_9BACT|nr:pentapeptide repeat-containing protein [Hyalangium sp. s54d21]MDY7233146.1 pentapeptide repeat-containing protein [Hyalangium sp. s54d21]